VNFVFRFLAGNECEERVYSSNAGVHVQVDVVTTNSLDKLCQSRNPIFERKRRNSRSNRLRERLRSLTSFVTRVLSTHVASMEDPRAEFARIDRDVFGIFCFSSDSSCVFDDLLVCKSKSRSQSGDLPRSESKEWRILTSFG
jgi:hypothetical protein